MGKAKIISGGPSGRYNVELVRDTARITTEIAAITARLASLTTGINEAAAAQNDALKAVDDALAALNMAITDLINEATTVEAVSDLQRAHATARQQYLAKYTNHKLLVLEKESKTKRLVLLQGAMAADYRDNIWCADLTENLAAGSEIGTIEINGEDAHVIIYPGGAEAPGLAALMQPALSSTPAGVFYNLAIMPGWQKFKPTFRTGRITAINGDNCTVALDAALSHERDFNINALSIMTNVPISYMTYNGEAFAVGDEVVVGFTGQDWTKPRVIGFVHDPRIPDSAFGDYYIVYKHGGSHKIAHCNSSFVVDDTKSAADIYMPATSYPVTFHAKRFTHNVPTNGTTVARDLYFVATSLYINPNPFPGWVEFCNTHPAHPLVVNNGNTNINMTDQVRIDLNAVNADVNNNHVYVEDALADDDWKILAAGESGDCEDFALTKAQRLLDMGYPASAIHIEGGFVDAESPGHAWLVVQTTDGDYALDRSSDFIVLNSALKASDRDYHSRRRQIGRNWAFISPFGWMLGAGNQIFPNSVWYILDPLLNIFYLLPPLKVRHMPFYRISDMEDATQLSSPSVNFSADNNSIYVAEDGTISEYTLNENSLDLVSTASYTGCGFVGRDGAIVAPDVYGRQDPFHWSDAVFLFQRDGAWHMANIAAGRIGGFKALYDCKVTSQQGYYDYEYVYLEGEFSSEEMNHSYDGDKHSWDRVMTIHYEDPEQKTIEHRKTTISFYEDYETPQKITNAVSDEGVYKREVLYPAVLPTDDTEGIRANSECINPVALSYPDDVPFDSDDYEASITTPFGESFNYYDANYKLGYGAYFAYLWTHVETKSLLLQGFMLHRPIDAGDDVLRMYRNGTSCIDRAAAAVQVQQQELLGIVFVPGADRLNNA